MTYKEFKRVIKPPDEIPVWVQYMVVIKVVGGFLFGIVIGWLLCLLYLGQ